MSEALRLLAEKKFGTLDPAERKFFQAVAERRPADFSVKVQAENDPAQANQIPLQKILFASKSLTSKKKTHVLSVSEAVHQM